MEFTPADIKRLYGARLFVLPGADLSAPLTPAPEPIEAEIPSAPTEEVQTVTTPEPTPIPVEPSYPAWLIEGANVSWKMKPGAKMAIILPEEEFRNKELTAFLKRGVVAAGIDPQYVGFGVYDNTAGSWDFRDMPVAIGLVCGACGGQLKEVTPLFDKHLLPTPSLSVAHSGRNRAFALKEALEDAWKRSQNL